MSTPIKYNLKTEIFCIALVLISFIAAVYFYNNFPQTVVTHWNLYGQPDGFSGRTTASFGIPLMLLAIYGLFNILPIFDPKKERYQDFAGVYSLFKASILFVLLGVYIASGLFNLGYNIKIGTVVPILIGLLMFVLGNYMGKIKSNWFVGMRNPWTLSSENVWNKTNRFSGRMMVLFGLILIATPFLPKAATLPLFILGILLLVLGSTLYSYILYRRETNNRNE